MMSLFFLRRCNAFLSRLFRLLHITRFTCCLFLVSCLSLSTYALIVASRDGLKSLFTFLLNFSRVDGFYGGPGTMSSKSSAALYSLRLSLLAKELMSFSKSLISGGGGVGQKLSPFYNRFVS